MCTGLQMTGSTRSQQTDGRSTHRHIQVHKLDGAGENLAMYGFVTEIGLWEQQIDLILESISI